MSASSTLSSNGHAAAAARGDGGDGAGEGRHPTELGADGVALAGRGVAASGDRGRLEPADTNVILVFGDVYIIYNRVSLS